MGFFPEEGPLDIFPIFNYLININELIIKSPLLQNTSGLRRNHFGLHRNYFGFHRNYFGLHQN
jgi:hypothetical protein